MAPRAGEGVAAPSSSRAGNATAWLDADVPPPRGALCGLDEELLGVDEGLWFNRTDRTGVHVVGVHGWDRPAVDGEDASVIAGGVAKGKAEPQPLAR
jgi:hypothetical protein